jgi:methyl-accepting chemotaxis protein
MLNKIKPFSKARLGTKILVCSVISAVFFCASIVFGFVSTLTGAGGGVPLLTYLVSGGLGLLGLASVIYFSLFLGGYLRRPMEGMTLGLNKMASGDLSYFNNDIEISDDTHDEMMLHAFTFIKLLNATREKVADTKQIADGDLTTYIHKKCANDMLGNALIDVVENTNRTVCAIASTADQVAISARMLSESSTSLSEGATSQASSVQELKRLPVGSSEADAVECAQRRAGQRICPERQKERHHRQRPDERNAGRDGGDQRLIGEYQQDHQGYRRHRIPDEYPGAQRGG